MLNYLTSDDNIRAPFLFDEILPRSGPCPPRPRDSPPKIHLDDAERPLQDRGVQGIGDQGSSPLPESLV
jgi:hypothetical protein